MEEDNAQTVDTARLVFRADAVDAWRYAQYAQEELTRANQNADYLWCDEPVLETPYFTLDTHGITLSGASVTADTASVITGETASVITGEDVWPQSTDIRLINEDGSYRSIYEVMRDIADTYEPAPPEFERFVSVKEDPYGGIFYPDPVDSEESNPDLDEFFDSLRNPSHGESA